MEFRQLSHILRRNNQQCTWLNRDAKASVSRLHYAVWLTARHQDALTMIESTVKIDRTKCVPGWIMRPKPRNTAFMTLSGWSPKTGMPTTGTPWNAACSQERDETAHILLNAKGLTGFTQTREGESARFTSDSSQVCPHTISRETLGQLGNRACCQAQPAVLILHLSLEHSTSAAQAA